MKNIQKFKFTLEQLNIINSTDAYGEVRAYAGTGKSATLDGRIRKHIHGDVSPAVILVLSHSKAAVDVLRSRLPEKVTIMTFHAYGLDRILACYRDLGLKKKPKVMTPAKHQELVKKAVKAERAQWNLIRAATKKDKIGDKREIRRLANLFTKMQGDKAAAGALASDQDRSFCSYLNVLEPIDCIYQQYLKHKRVAAVLDYADMLLLGRKVLKQGNGLSFEYLYVDEYQDISDGQADLLRELAKRIPKIMVFGDPCQSVYRFGGGRYRPLSDILDNVKTFELTESFRMPQAIADHASAIIAPLLDKPVRILGRKKSVKTVQGLRPVLRTCGTLQDLVEKTLERVGDYRTRSGKKGGSVGILARTRAELRDVEVALLAAGYPIHQLHRTSDPQHLAMVLDVLEMLETWSERIDMEKISESRKMKWKMQMELLAAAGMDDGDIHPEVSAACRRDLRGGLLSSTLQGRYMVARKVYEKLLRHKGQLTADLHAELGLWEPLCARFDCADDLRNYMRKVRRRTPVETSTIHRAKGLEWDHVLVLSATQGSLPDFRATIQEALDEERRLLYVAASRSRKTLDLFQAPYYHAKGGEFKALSQFLTPEVRRLQISE